VAELQGHRRLDFNAIHRLSNVLIAQFVLAKGEFVRRRPHAGVGGTLGDSVQAEASSPPAAQSFSATWLAVTSPTSW
ncbi:MAG TPA: hypothetical protein QF604_11725, partial [Candidatus Latescibacteria bacterium]|nr:hypothetical protein [Candidatus Latescibacterota bacterium]